MKPRANRLMDNMVRDSGGNVWICEDAFLGIRCLRSDGTEVNYGADKGIAAHINVVKQASDGSIIAGGVGKSSDPFRYDRATEQGSTTSVRPWWSPKGPASR